MTRASHSGARGQGLDPHVVRHVVSLSKTNLLLKGTGNTQEAVMTKNLFTDLYWDVKQKTKRDLSYGHC